METPQLDQIEIRAMRDEDVSFADTLRETVGWNQTKADWRRFLSLAPSGCFVAENYGTPAGTATTISYEGTVAWIGMVLVKPEARGLGIGKALLHHCLSHLKTSGVRCIKLDATPAGEPLYRKLGFQAEWSLARWEGKVPAEFPVPSPEVLPLSPGDLDHVLELDRRAFGCSREHLLAKLIEDSEAAVWAPPNAGSPSAAAYGMLRAGSRALYLGPAVRANTGAGLAVASALLKAAEGRTVFWDIPEAQEEAIKLARDLGFQRQRPFTRMYWGENDKAGDPRLQVALADPATG